MPALGKTERSVGQVYTYFSIAVNFVQNDVFVRELLVERQLAWMEDQVWSVDVAAIVTGVEQLLVRRVHEYALRGEMENEVTSRYNILGILTDILSLELE